MAQSKEVRAAKKEARQRLTAARRELAAKRQSEAAIVQAGKRFGGRITRNGLDKSLRESALTRDEYLAAERRRLVGPTSAGKRSPFNEAVASELHGVELNAPRQARRWFGHEEPHVKAHVPTERDQEQAVLDAEWDGWWDGGPEPSWFAPIDNDLSEDERLEDWEYVIDEWFSYNDEDTPRGVAPPIDDRPEWEIEADSE